MAESVVVPGPRDVRGRLETGAADRCVVACPPHPKLGGNRNDRRLRGVAEALGDRDIACLRFDYGPWNDGYGELADTKRAIEWANGRFDAVGCFGYSFGGSITLLAATESDLGCVSVLAPAGRLAEDLDPAAGLASITAPVQVIFGERDTTVDWAPVVERARDLGFTVESVGADHHFVGQHGKIAVMVADFVTGHLADG